MHLEYIKEQLLKMIDTSIPKNKGITIDIAFEDAYPTSEIRTLLFVYSKCNSASFTHVIIKKGTNDSEVALQIFKESSKEILSSIQYVKERLPKSMKEKLVDIVVLHMTDLVDLNGEIQGTAEFIVEQIMKELKVEDN